MTLKLIEVLLQKPNEQLLQKLVLYHLPHSRTGAVGISSSTQLAGTSTVQLQHPENKSPVEDENTGKFSFN